MWRLRPKALWRIKWFLASVTLLSLLSIISLGCEAVKLEYVGGDIKFVPTTTETDARQGFPCQEIMICGHGKFGRWQGDFQFGWEAPDNTNATVDETWYGKISVGARPVEGIAFRARLLRGRSFPSSSDLLCLVDGSRYDQDTTGIAVEADFGHRVAVRAAKIDRVENIGDNGCLTFVEATLTPNQSWSFLFDAIVLSPHPVEHMLASGMRYTTFTAQKILSLQAEHRLLPTLNAAAQVAVADSERLTRRTYIQQRSLAGCVRLGTMGRAWSRSRGGHVQLVGATQGFRSYLGDPIVGESGLAWELGGYMWLTPKLGARAKISSLEGEKSDELSALAGGWEMRYLGKANLYQLQGDDDECVFSVTFPRKGYQERALKTMIQYRWSNGYLRTNVSGLNLLASSCTVDYRQDPSAFRFAIGTARKPWNTELVYRKHRESGVEQIFAKITRDTEFGSISMYYGNDDGGKLDAGWKKSPVVGVGCQIML